MRWYIAALKKYAVFNGRSQRAEYWMFALFNFLISLALAFIDGALGVGGLLSFVYGLAIIIPGLSVTIRRLHDTDRSGWWVLIAFVPILGVLILLVFMVLDSTPGRNRFGPNPKELGADAI